MKMAEDLGNVYDILFPSPPNLTKIVSISVAVDLWCHEINTRRIANTLDQLNLHQNILSISPIPRYLPISILPEVEKYVKRIGRSINQWVLLHAGRDLFEDEIFNYFADFAADFDGSIHLVNTAKRLVLCDRIDHVLRLKIACTYCFESDILQIWPTVSSHVHPKRSSVWSNPVLYYWMCRLSNQVNELPEPEHPYQTVEETVFCNPYTANWSFIEYFWNRFDAASRMRTVIHSPVHFIKFYRYFLTKYNEIELDEFVRRNALPIVYILLRKGSPGEDALKGGPHYVNGTIGDIHPYIRAIWNFIKNRISANGLYFLVRKVLFRLRLAKGEFDTSSCCEVWITAPDRLKHPVIQLILQDVLLFTDDRFVIRSYSDSVFEFLFVVLSDASAEERRIFWTGCWNRMIHRVTASQLNELMNFCLNNENEILEFKQNYLSVFGVIQLNIVRLLLEMRFDELNEFLNFCCPNELRRRHILRELVTYFHANVETIANITQRANDFIDYAFGDDDVERAADFKRWLVSSERATRMFKRYIINYGYRGDFHHVIRFIEILAPSEEIVRTLKKYCLFPLFKNMIHAGYYLLHFGEGEFISLINVSLNSEAEMMEFKNTLSVTEVVLGAILTAVERWKDEDFRGEKYNSFLVQFLQWHFDDPQALEKFKAEYAEIDVFMQLTTRPE